MHRGSEPCCTVRMPGWRGLPRTLRGRCHRAEGSLSVRGLRLGFSPRDAGVDVVCQGHSPAVGYGCVQLSGLAQAARGPFQPGRKRRGGKEARRAGGVGGEGLPGRARSGSSGRPRPWGGLGGGLRSVCACVPARRPRPSPGGAARWAGAGVFTVTWTRRWQLGRCQVIGAEEPPPQPGRKMQDGPAGP